MDAPILTTRLEVPPPRARQMQRPRLLARLNAALQPPESEAARLVLVSAPAGFGKTTLLSGWVRASGQPAAWFSLDDGDNDIVRFLRYLLAALGRVDSSLGAGLPEALRAASLSGESAPVLIEQSLTILINQIHAGGKPIILVLDDYHLVRQEHIHHAVTFLLHHLPPRMLLVIASRSDPPLPLARLRARGELIELRQADLRFSADESAAFLRQITGLELAKAETQALDARTEGWAAGLQMAGLAIQGELAGQNPSAASAHLDLSAFLEAFNGSNRYVLDYLVEEVFQDQPAEVQAFLLKTSILERMSAGLCAAVMDDLPEATAPEEAPLPVKQRAAHYQALLEHLDRSNLFILPLDNQHSWFRYHMLFGDLLRNRLEATLPEQVHLLHGRASLWFERSGLLREAIQHALAAQDHARALILIEAAAITALQQGELTTLNAWVEALPPELVHARPALDVLWLWARFFSGAPLEILQAQLHRLENAPADVRAKAQILRAFLETYQGRMDHAADILAQASAALPEKEPYFRGVASWLNGVIILNKGSLEEALPIIEDTARQAQESGNAMTVVLALSQVGVQLARRGQLETARETLKKAVALASDRQGNVFPVASMALAYLAELHREAGEVEPARRTLEQAITLSRGWRASTAMSAYVVLARLHAMHGEHEQADQAIQVALRLAGQTEETRMDDFSINAERARLRALAGRFDRVAEWARQLASQAEKLVSEEEQFILRRLDKYHTLVLARLAIASGSPAEALQMLEAQLPVLEQLGRTSMVIENLALQALAWDVRGEARRALEMLERAAWLAYRGQYFRLLLDEGPPLLPLLARLRAECAAQPEQNAELLAYLDRLLAGQTPAPPVSEPPAAKPASQALIEPLSERELEVLRLLDTGLATSEIAEKLNVTLHTVRSHFKSIFGKLDAHSRYEALARARALGIL